MDDSMNDSEGPFSVLSKKFKRKSAKQHSQKLRDLLGESTQEESDSDTSKFSASSSTVEDEDVRSVRKCSFASSTSTSKSDINSCNKAVTTNKREECTAMDIQLRQNLDHAIVNEECDGMKELTKGIESMNNGKKENKKSLSVYCESGEELDEVVKISGDDIRRKRVDSESKTCSSQSSPSTHGGLKKTHVKRKHNIFYHEMEENGLDSGLEEQGATSQKGQKHSTEKIVDHNRNTPSHKVANDGLLSRFQESQSSVKARKRHQHSNASDFERKMDSQISSRSSSTRSYASSVPASIDSGLRMGFQEPHSSVVVVAIDFGTTFSGYAFAFTRDPESIHMMRKWEGGDPGVNNQKIPTTLLLRPDGSFHSFGYGARDFYHDLEPADAKRWLYFEKFKMSLHSSEDLNPAVLISAANGKPFPAWKVFAHALRFFKEHVLTELSDQSTARILEEDITWVLTVPAIWRQPAKQFMRTAAHEAGIASWESPERLLIALEPEAASIFCRKLRIRDCIIEDDVRQRSQDDSLISEDFDGATQYIVVDCGGGTVDLTVHELDVNTGTLKELHRGTGGACGATGIDAEFEKLMKRIFDAEFIERFKLKRPAGWVDMLIAFESKKRTARPGSNTALNISLPYSFIDYYKRKRRSAVENAIKKLKNPDIKWSSQGMMRIAPSVMEDLFKPVVQQILSHVRNLLHKPDLVNIKHLFLVGGFAESHLLQRAVRDEFKEQVRVVIPHDVGLTILKGAVQFGLDPTVVRVRRSALTYGVGVLNKFNPDKHDLSKKVVKDGVVWCKDILDTFVCIDDSVGLGDAVTRSYAPARIGQKSTVINIYCSEKKDNLYTTDKNVKKCGQLRIEMPELTIEDIPEEKRNKPRELQATMLFGDTELKVTALDVLTGKTARALVDFLNY